MIISALTENSHIFILPIVSPELVIVPHLIEKGQGSAIICVQQERRPDINECSLHVSITEAFTPNPLYNRFFRSCKFLPM